MRRTMRGLRGGLSLPNGSAMSAFNPETAPVAQAVGGGVTYTYTGSAVDIQMGGAAGNISVNINNTGDFLWRATAITLRLNEEITLATNVFPKGYVIPHRAFCAGLTAGSAGVPECLTMGNFRAAYAFGKDNGMNLPVPLDQISGNAMFPFFLPTPFRVPRNTVIVWSILNEIVASTAFSGLASAKVNAFVSMIGEAL